MIKVKYYMTSLGILCGYKIENHGDKIVCAAVSALAINCANSVESLCDCDVKSTGGTNGILQLLLPGFRRGDIDGMALLLIKSLELGLQSINDSYPGQLDFTYAEAPDDIF